VCVSSGDVYASQFLIENGADVNVALPESLLTPLHLAVLQTHDPSSTSHMSSIIELLLQKAANANACDSNSRWVCGAAELLRLLGSKYFIDCQMVCGKNSPPSADYCKYVFLVAPADKLHSLVHSLNRLSWCVGKGILHQLSDHSAMWLWA